MVKSKVYQNLTGDTWKWQQLYIELERDIYRLNCNLLLNFFFEKNNSWEFQPK